MTRTPDRRTLLLGAAGASAVALQPSLLAAPARLAAPVRVGLVGCGRQGRSIAGELAKFPDVSVVSVCDVDERRLNGMRRRARDAERFASVDDLLEGPEVDAIVVATPTHLHREPSEKAVRAGKHVYCEGPLAASLEDARAIARAARGAETVFQVGFQGRANPVYDLARSFVKSGAIRETVSMRAQSHRKSSWRVPADDPERAEALNWKLDPERSLGLAGELGAQQFDVLHWFTGEYPVAARASGSVRGWKDGRETPDTVHVELTWPSGARLLWEGTLANSYGGTYEVLHGTMGAVKLAWSHGWLFKEADAPTQGWEVYANRQTFHDDEGITLIADATKLAAQGKLESGVGLPHPGLYYALEAFLRSVTDGVPVVCGASEGLRATAVAVRAVEALRSGGEVAIDESTLSTD